MTYTRKQLEKMSDFEVNKALCLKLGYDVSGATEERNYMTNAVSDFCHQWHLIMPLADEFGVEIIYEGDFTVASNNAISAYMEDFRRCKYFKHKSTQRAIACCLLMMELT